MTEFDLRKAVEQYINRAIDSVKNYTGEEYEQNRWNWTQITTDRILAAVMNSLPEPVDTMKKYETEATGGIYINKDELENPYKMEFFTSYVEDQGYNKYFFDYTDYLKKLYTLPEPVVQSEHAEDITIHRTNTSETDQGEEPSKVS